MSDETKSLPNASASHDERLEIVLADILRCTERGEAVDRQNLLAQHPEFAEDLQEFFANQKLFQRAVAPSTAPAGAATRLRYFGDYELLEEIAHGGMGVVYKARQTSLNRLVAIKMILAGQLANDQEVKRFQAEAEAAANLHHPGVVAIYEVGMHDGQHYYSMEYVQGRDLATVLREKPVSVTQAAQYLREIAEIIEFAHSQGVLHRDLKPSNILIDSSDRLRITDFGLAKRAQSASDLTITGQVLGTPNYMSPEQAAAQHAVIGPTTDVYSLGTILYELLTGRPPFRSDNIGETLRQVQQEEPVRPRLLNPKLPRDLETICLKCLEKEPRRRYATSQELADELGRFLRGEPIHARPIGSLARTWRWCRRKPVVAGLSATSAVALTVAVVVLIYSRVSIADAFGKLEIEQSRTMNALTQRTEALGQKTAALKEKTDALERLSIEEQKAREALAGKTRALHDLELSTEQVKESLQREQQIAYSHAIALAHREWQANNLVRAEEILDALPPELRGWEWHYLKRLCHLESVSLQWPAAPAEADGREWHVAVNSVAFSPDGKYLACGSGEVDFGEKGEIKVWDLTTQKEVFTCSHELGPVFKVVYSPDGAKLASVDKEGGIKIWDASTGMELAEIQGPDAKARSCILDVQFSSNGKQLVTTPPTTLWDLETKEEIKSFPDGVWSVAFSHDGGRLASSGNGNIKIWDLVTGQEIVNLAGHSGSVYSVAFSPDDQRLASASVDGTAKVWDAVSGKELVTYRGHTTPVYRVAFSRNGKLVATVGGDYSAVIHSQPGEVKIWEAKSGKDVATLRGHPSAATDVAFDPTADRLASVSKDGSIRIWDLTGSRDVRILPGGGSGTSASNLLFSADGKLLITPQGGALKVWDVSTGRERMSFLTGNNHSFEKVALSPDQHLLAAAVNGGPVKVWDLRNQQEMHSLTGFTNTDSFSFTADGTELVAGQGRQGVKVWDVSTGKEKQSELWSQLHGGSLVWGAGAARIAIKEDRGNLRILESPGKLVHSLPVAAHGLGRLVFNGNGNLIAGATVGKVIRVWDVASGRELQALRGHVGGIYGIAFHPDSRRLASCSDDKTVKIWDLETGRELLTLRSLHGVLYDLAFSPDGKCLAARNMGGTVLIWETMPMGVVEEPVK